MALSSCSASSAAPRAAAGRCPRPRPRPPRRGARRGLKTAAAALTAKAPIRMILLALRDALHHRRVDRASAPPSLAPSLEGTRGRRFRRRRHFRLQVRLPKIDDFLLICSNDDERAREGDSLVDPTSGPTSHRPGFRLPLLLAPPKSRWGPRSHSDCAEPPDDDAIAAAAPTTAAGPHCLHLLHLLHRCRCYSPPASAPSVVSVGFLLLYRSRRDRRGALVAGVIRHTRNARFVTSSTGGMVARSDDGEVVRGAPFRRCSL